MLAVGSDFPRSELRVGPRHIDAVNVQRRELAYGMHGGGHDMLRVGLKWIRCPASILAAARLRLAVDDQLGRQRVDACVVPRSACRPG